jgi:hypothetical protein
VSLLGVGAEQLGGSAARAAAIYAQPGPAILERLGAEAAAGRC